MRNANLLLLSTVLFCFPVTMFSQANALSFDGVNDYVNISNSTGYNIGTSTQFTIEAWIKTGAGGDMAILSKTDP
ncbi:MAG: hypothetical protein MUE99_07520, partial [Chitinophagaceae bacterium]|nr:hypothetical protein [Chitinophagaceae bacterium]